MLRRMDASFCRFRVTVRIRVIVDVRIRVTVGMPIPEYRYGKNARTATHGKNRYGLPVLHIRSLMAKLD